MFASTFQQQLKEENPKHAKNKAFEEVADIGHNESQLEEEEDSRFDTYSESEEYVEKVILRPPSPSDYGLSYS